jgi:hypothetical protein
MMTRKTAKRKKGVSEDPCEVPRETTASEPVQTKETQSIPNESRIDSVNVGRGASSEVEEHDPTPVTITLLLHPTEIIYNNILFQSIYIE